ncbi:PDGLE domain-containing protein (plasmid) [Haloferax sp. S1W]|uniref:PDGLE domain-containing protein n=1 Tax=Haloferax sp. S1W TaxID=3377110 RepID=UPI0037CA799B
MSAGNAARDGWQQRSLIGLGSLVVLAPVFGWAASQTGYAEPMDNAAELAGAASQAVPTSVSLLPGYTLPGLGPHVGTFAAALLGTLLTLLLALAFGRTLARLS